MPPHITRIVADSKSPEEHEKTDARTGALHFMTSMLTQSPQLLSSDDGRHFRALMRYTNDRDLSDRILVVKCIGSLMANSSFGDTVGDIPGDLQN